jgi:hypothetical protein
MYLQVLAQRARVPLRRQGDGGRNDHFPPILAAPTVLPPGSKSNFYMLFLGHFTRKMEKDILQGNVDGSAFFSYPNKRKCVF